MKGDVATPSDGHPYRIAVLCDLRDSRGRILLLHRRQEPNSGLYSPIGGKLDTASGESPAQCARREILEEAGVDIPLHRLRLQGLISERGYPNSADLSARTNWLLFYYRVEGPVDFEAFDMREGRLEWIDPADVPALPRPETDRRIIWPLVTSHPDGFFAVHIECEGPQVRWSVEQSTDGE
jgi:8-oxo-dGTP diphosphatase